MQPTYRDFFQSGKAFMELDFSVLKYSDGIDYESLDSYPIIKDTDVQLMKKSNQSLPHHFWIKGTHDTDPSLAVLAGIHSIYPQICDEMLNMVNDSLGLTLGNKEIFLAKTTGSTFRHSDYPGRIGTVNCFLKNAEFAVTEFYSDSLVPNPFEILAAETGKCYLVNTSIQHRVIQPPKLGRRYLFMVKVPV